MATKVLLKAMEVKILRAAHHRDHGFDANNRAGQSLVQFENGSKAVVLDTDLLTQKHEETSGAFEGRANDGIGETKPFVGPDNANPPLDAEGLRTDGPTKDEWIASGYQADNYPPSGYAKKDSVVTNVPASTPPAEGAQA